MKKPDAAIRARNRLDVQRYTPSRQEAAAQAALRESYRSVARNPLEVPLSEYGFSAYSQTDEDGILLYLASAVGTTNRVAVEICAGDGLECNAANLILNHGWHALLVDGDPANVARAKSFYSRSRASRIHPPACVQEWVTRDSVNTMVESHGFSGEIDLLSLDLDGVDYWIWEALTVVEPRIVVLEYQDILGPDRAWTVPYSDDFAASEHSMSGDMPDYAGASLSAFVKLGRRKGYRLVGINRYGYNAFFVQDGLATDLLPEVEVAACFTHPKTIEGMRTRFPRIAGMPWVEV
jgi:hypothetical protein